MLNKNILLLFLIFFLNQRVSSLKLKLNIKLDDEIITNIDIKMKKNI